MNALLNVFLVCPWCNGDVEIIEINCAIFRHAIHKDGRAFNPHASQNECDNAMTENLVFGCAKPIRLVTEDGKQILVKCDYI